MIETLHCIAKKSAVLTNEESRFTKAVPFFPLAALSFPMAALSFPMAALSFPLARQFHIVARYCYSISYSFFTHYKTN